MLKKIRYGLILTHRNLKPGDPVRAAIRNMLVNLSTIYSDYGSAGAAQELASADGEAVE
jgi:hypothetical protein